MLNPGWSFFISGFCFISSLSAFAQSPSPLPADLNEDGIVDGLDHLLFQQYWHQGEKYTPTPSPTLTPTIGPSATPSPTPTRGTSNFPTEWTLLYADTIGDSTDYDRDIENVFGRQNGEDLEIWISVTEDSFLTYLNLRMNSDCNPQTGCTVLLPAGQDYSINLIRGQVISEGFSQQDDDSCAFHETAPAPVTATAALRDITFSIPIEPYNLYDCMSFTVHTGYPDGDLAPDDYDITGESIRFPAQ